MTGRPKYLWRVTADLGGYTQTRHYQTAKAAEDRRVRWLAGALAVTVERSNRVTFPTDVEAALRQP
jgi:hypothetical protein